MAKFSAADVADKVKSLYGPKDSNREIIGTGATLRRPTKPGDFVLAPKDHPWQALTGLLGLPYDAIIQIAGAYDSGKSTLAGEFMAAAQRQGVYVVLGDSEKKFDKIRYDNHFKGNSEELMVVQSTMIRKLAGGMFKYVKSIKEMDPTAKILLVHDSIGGSVSKSRLEHEIDSAKGTQPGSEAVENSDYMKHMVAMMDKYPGSITLVLINQMTDRIGFGLKGQSRSGGHKISFHSSLIIEMKKIKTLTRIVNKVKMKTGIITRAKVDKNHLSSSENSVAEMNILVTAGGWEKSDFSFEKEDKDE
jgi:RecA/RadA recombinase